MAKMRTDKKSLIRWKVYIDRARMYIGYIQFMMIGFVLLESYKDTPVGTFVFDNLWVSIPILFLIFIGMSLVIGRIDTVIGFREEELRNASTSNPIMREIQSNIEEIRNELKELRNNSGPKLGKKE